MNSRPNQCMRIVEYIAEHGSITQKEASDNLGVSRLPSRIHELHNKHGYTIKSEYITVKNRHDETCRVKWYMIVEK